MSESVDIDMVLLVETVSSQPGNILQVMAQLLGDIR